MRIYLAATSNGIKGEQRVEAVHRFKPLYILESFAAGEKKCVMAQNTVENNNFLLDSGAFTFMNGKNISKIKMEEFVERYIEHIKKHKIKHYFEMDVDSIFGYEQVKIWRNKIEKAVGIQSIPVWHKTRGIDDFKRLVDEYSYISIGGFAIRELKPKEYPAVKKMVIYAREKDVKVHGLGFTNIKYLLDFPFYSVDSASWSLSAVRGGNIYKFKNGTISTIPLKNENKLKLSNMAFYSFGEWVKFQKYMDTRRY